MEQFQTEPVQSQPLILPPGQSPEPDESDEGFWNGELDSDDTDWLKAIKRIQQEEQEEQQAQTFPTPTTPESTGNSNNSINGSNQITSLANLSQASFSKYSHEAAEYTDYAIDGRSFCNICTHFQPPDGCTKVVSPVSPWGWCGSWELDTQKYSPSPSTVKMGRRLRKALDSFTAARFAFGQPMGFFHGTDGKIHPIVGGGQAPAQGKWERKNQDTAQGHQFPENLSQLQTVQPLGGSTGAMLMKDPQTSQQYVMKKGNNPDHIENEMVADQAYQALGANVAPFQRYVDENGQPVKLAKLIPGPTLGDIEQSGSPELRAGARAVLAQHLAQHALLANWDAHGLEKDNVLFSNENDQPYFIDNGGSLEYRAQGSPKGPAFSDTAGELETLRSPAKNPQMSEIFKNLTPDDVRQQVESINTDKWKSLMDVLPEHLQDKISKRLVAMRMRTSAAPDNNSGMGGLTT